MSIRTILLLNNIPHFETSTKHTIIINTLGDLKRFDLLQTSDNLDYFKVSLEIDQLVAEGKVFTINRHYRLTLEGLDYLKTLKQSALNAINSITDRSLIAA